MLDHESEQLYTELKGIVKENAEQVARTLDALVRIHEDKLYRAEFKTFDAFCRSVGMNRRKAYRMLEDKAKKPKRIAATVAEKVRAMDVMEGVFLKPAIPTVPAEWPDVTGTGPADVTSAKEKVAAMMEKLSIKPVIDVRAEQYRTHTPIPAMDRPEEDMPVPMLAFERKTIASTELKAWAEKRRAMNDATSEDDAAWACYIAQQIML